MSRHVPFRERTNRSWDLRADTHPVMGLGTSRLPGVPNGGSRANVTSTQLNETIVSTQLRPDPWYYP